MMAEIKGGALVQLQKDCGCITHDGPHWLYANDLWRERNRELLAIAGDKAVAPLRRRLALMGHAREEIARLAEKGNLLERHGIARIIRAADQH